MMRTSLTSFFTFGLVAIGLALNTVNAMPPPPSEIDQQKIKQQINEHKTDLVKATSKSFDELKVISTEHQEVNSPIKLYIAPSELTFQKRWLRDRRTELTKSYLKNTTRRYQSVFDEQIKKAFSKDKTL